MTPESRDATKGWLQAIRRDWDARAKENPRAYINWPEFADNDDAFFASGRQDYEKYVPPFLKKTEFDPRGKVALEIGCGIGRLAKWMSADFGKYIGVDVSPEMVRKASSYGFANAEFQAASGGDLARIASESVDFVFSFAVFQHVPDKDAIFNYFAETARVLRRGGIFRLHMKGLWSLTFGGLALEAGYIQKGGAANTGRSRWPFIRVRNLDTWQGQSIRPGEAKAKCEETGLEVVDVEAAWTPMMWVGGRKK
ncbi:MAG TPA: methyltransferase domain-containing protein [Candidatus Acidoferrales bacterium]|nr:methyltransferase domain-containing protein [Candidatus Acidoferrales bacterium]